MSGLEFGNSVEKRNRIMAHIQGVGLKFEETFAKYEIDVIIGPSDSGFCQFSAARGKSIEGMMLSITVAKSPRLSHRYTPHIVSRVQWKAVWFDDSCSRS